jgi:crotonobetainyl-CoA:carnitine CoA-transferase CaiB-like acyl-CoA transferase
VSDQDDPRSGALSDLVVIELGDEGTQACGKFLADMGARVIKVEPLDGVGARHRGPYLRGHEGDPNASLYFWAHNTSKESIALDLRDESARGSLDSLIGTADVLLEDYPVGALEALGLGYQQLAAKWPRLVYVSITPFGQAGPCRGWKSSDLIAWATGGAMAMVGYSDHSTTPFVPQGDLTYQLAGQWASIGVLTAIAARDQEGLGEHVDVSLQEVVALTTGSYATAPLEYLNQMDGRNDLGNMVPTRDGEYIVAQMLNITDDKWQAFKDWIIEQGVAGELAGLHPAEFESNRPEVLEAVARLAQLWDAAELCTIGQKFGFTWMKVNSAADLVRDPQLRSRTFFKKIEHPELGTSFEYAGPGAEWSEAGWAIRSRPPLLGEHNLMHGLGG